MPPGGRGRGSGAKAQSRQAHKNAAQGFRNTRRWKEDGFDGIRTRNVRYTELENEKLLHAVKAFCDERSLDEESFRQSIKDERQKGKTWVRIAALCNIDRRSVQSMSQRLRKLFFGSIRWSLDQMQLLVDAVTACGGTRPSWRQISDQIGASPEQCKDKWKAICGAGKSGRFSTMENWALRQGVCELTGSLAPIANVPWPRVRHWVPHRSAEQCRFNWSTHILPVLLQYQDQYGVPIEADVFHRLLLRKLKKSGVEDVGDVNWQLVNGWWSASLTRQHWKKLEIRAPRELREASFPELVAWLYDALECRRHRKRDRRVLRHARLVIEAQAENMSDSEAEGRGRGEDGQEGEAEEEMAAESD